MEISLFASTCLSHCERYFSAIAAESAKGLLVDENDRAVTPHYPTMLLVYETPTHFVAELLGSSDQIGSLRVVRRILPTVDDALGNFPAPWSRSHFTLAPGCRGSSLAHMALLGVQDEDLFKSRYPELENLMETVLMLAGEFGAEEALSPISMPLDCHDFWLTDVLLHSSWQGRVRARYFQAAWFVERNASSGELKLMLQTMHPVGTDTTLLAPSVEHKRSLLVTAANFASLSSINKVGETTITRFLEANERVLTAALDGVRVIPQPRLEWLEGNPDPDEEAIQPDFLLIDASGQAHICEVKLPLLNKSSLTTGGHRRRYFINPIVEGIAQIANYQEYFEQPRHRDLLMARYGVSIDAPRSILIAGSFENFEGEEVRQAQRMLNVLKPVELIDYDSLRALFLMKSGHVTEHDESDGGSLGGDHQTLTRP